MKSTAQTHPDFSANATVEDTLEQLNALTKEAAEVLREKLRHADIQQYKHFLDTMFHYTRNTGYKAKTAAENIPIPALKDFFMHMHREEKGHYLLALKDLEGLGEQPTTEAPKEVKQFDAFWDSLANKHYTAYLGSLYVFENIAGYLTRDIRDFIARLNLSKKQCRWLAVHAEADLEHGAEAVALIKQYLTDNPLSMIAAAREASHIWINIMHRAFQA